MVDDGGVKDVAKDIKMLPQGGSDSDIHSAEDDERTL